MTPDQIAAVKASFRQIAPAKDEVAALFYERLFARAPDLRALFAQTDMKSQGAKLVATLAYAVNGLDEPGSILDAVRDLARRHVGYGVEERHYDIVGAALLETLSLGLRAGFTPELREAWTQAYRLLSGVMMEAARGVPRAA